VALFDATEYPQVRALLDITLKVEQLPDEIIALDAFHGDAERDVLTRVPDAESRTGTQLRRLVHAALLLCAANLAPALPRLLRDKFADQEIQLAPVDMAKRALALQAQAYDEIAAVLNEDGTEQTVEIPTLFVAAPADRWRGHGCSRGWF
jgi:hypothetical protein